MDPDEIIAQLQAGQFGQGGASSSATAPVANVYLGTSGGVHSRFDNKQVATDGVESDRIENKAPSDEVADVDSAAAKIYGWSDAELRKWEKLLLDNGLIKPGSYNYEDLVAAWQQAVQGASNLYAAGKKVTPQQYVDVYVGSKFSGKAAVDRDRTATSYTEVDDADARAAAEETYSSLLGRKPKPGEIRGLHAALQAYAQAHPSITTEHTQKDGDTVTRQSGGASAAALGQIAEDAVKAKPGYAEFQAATTVNGWLSQALGPAVSGY